MDTDLDPIWRGLGGGALVAATLTIVRLLLEHHFRHRERRFDQAERRGAFERDAEARLERVLQDRLSEADRRYTVLLQLHESLKDQYASLHAEHAVLLAHYRLMLDRHADSPPALLEP
jgi:hypothetical protein